MRSFAFTQLLMHPLWHQALVRFIPGLRPPTDTQIPIPLSAVCPWHYLEGSSLNGKCHPKMEIKGEEERKKGREMRGHEQRSRQKEEMTVPEGTNITSCLAP